MVFNQLRIERNENAFLELMPVGLHMIHFSLAHCDVSSLRLAVLVVKNAAFLKVYIPDTAGALISQR